MRALIIIPTYNEAENIKKLIEQIEQTLIHYCFSILIVDDSSPDNTGDIVEQMKKAYPNLYLLKRKEKTGLASAYIEGMKFGLNNHFDVFVEFDADFSHNPKYLPYMLDKLKTHDFVIASRNIKGGASEGWGAIRNIISKGGSYYSRLILNCPIYDLTGGFNGWRADLIKKINLDKIISKGYSFQIEMKYRAYLSGAKFFEFPIIFENRKRGVSKMDKKIFLEALVNIIKLRFLKDIN